MTKRWFIAVLVGGALASTTIPAAAAAPAIPHPTGASSVVVSIVHEPNGWGADYDDGFDVLVFGDGRVVISPPASGDVLAPTLREFRVSERGLQRLLRAARRAGLLTKTNFGDAGVTDQGTSEIRVVAAGKARTFLVYALLLEDGDRGLPSRQRDARQALRRFVHNAARRSFYR
jgi:hypothetical protein